MGSFRHTVPSRAFKGAGNKETMAKQWATDYASVRVGWSVDRVVNEGGTWQAYFTTKDSRDDDE